MPPTFSTYLYVHLIALLNKNDMLKWCSQHEIKVAQLLMSLQDVLHYNFMKEKTRYKNEEVQINNILRHEIGV